MAFLKTHRKRVLFVAALGVVIFLIGGFAFLQNNRPKAPIIIYKTTLPSKTEVNVENPDNPQTQNFGSGFVEDTDAPTTDDPHAENSAAEDRDVLSENDTDLTALTDGGFDASEVSEDKVDYGSSPFGYGTYPEIPTDYPYTPIWTRSAQARAHYSRGNLEDERILELMSRVRLKLWEMGERHVKGVAYANGLIYPTQPDTVYVDIQDFKDGGSISAIGSPISEEDMDLISIGLSPPGITVLDMSEGIEPISFLGL